MLIAKDYEEPEDLQGHMSAFSQIGPPRNVTVDENENGDFLVSWIEPEYGHDILAIYIVRWYLEPSHLLTGKAETRNTYYAGNWNLFNNIRTFY